MFPKFCLLMFVFAKMSRHPVRIGQLVVGFIVILGLYELLDDIFQFLLIGFEGSKPEVHLVGVDAEVGVDDERRGEVVVLRQLPRRHAHRLHLVQHLPAWVRRRPNNHSGYLDNKGRGHLTTPTHLTLAL